MPGFIFILPIQLCSIATVAMIIATIDRQEGARENVERAGYAFDALFTVEDLGIEKDTD